MNNKQIEGKYHDIEFPGCFVFALALVIAVLIAMFVTIE